MADVVVTYAIERIADLLIEEGKFLYGVRDQVEDMKVELKRMQCFLKDADAKKDGDERICNWVAEITDLAYRIGDVLETFAIQAASKRERRSMKNILKRFPCIFSKGISVRKVGLEIEAIKGRITNLTTSLQNHGIRCLNDGESSSTSTNEKVRWLRTTYPHVIEQDFVGMETDMEQLMSRLTDNKGICEVISIKGMGGLGKTTIATKLFNNTSLQSGFHHCVWVCITQTCQMKVSMQQLLKELAPKMTKRIMCMEYTELVQKVNHILQVKKCLVVIDDIWAKDDWEILKPAFPIGLKCGTKVLLTTRKLEVEFVHSLGCLTEDEGWKLLQLKAFPRREEIPEFSVDPEIEKIGRNIVRQCEKLPLAVSVLGGVLKGKSMIREWEMVNKDIESYLRRGDGIEEDQGGLMRVLGLSYTDLPYCLKHCFLYFARFPGGSSIEVGKLYKLWLGEGLISSDDIGVEETMMDVAERYLHELARRSMVQVQSINENVFSEVKRFESCRLHDVMQDLCSLLAKKENFANHIDVTENESSKFATYMSSSITKIQRLSVFSDKSCDEYFVHENHNLTMHLRSLLFSNVQGQILPLKISGISKFKLMRVLELVCIDFSGKSLSKEVEGLIHLRYLSLFGCTILELPSCIGQLHYLQTLDLRVSTLVSLPNVIWKLRRLKHLYLPNEYILKDEDELLELVGLSELEILCIPKLEFSSFRDLISSTNLRVLSLDLRDLSLDQGNSRFRLKNLINYLNTIPPQQRRTKLTVSRLHTEDFLKERNTLELLFKCITLNCLTLNGPLRDLPVLFRSDNYSPNLTSIELDGSKLSKDPMCVLEKIPNLQNLRLSNEAYIGETMMCSDGGFLQLRNLELVDFPCLKHWNVSAGAMPKLRSLEIAVCWELRRIPEGLKDLQSLENIVLAFMPKSFMGNLMVTSNTIGIDSHIIEHVKSVTFL